MTLERYAAVIDALIDGLGLSDYEKRELRDSFEGGELAFVSDREELKTLLVKKAAPFLAMKRRRQVRDCHQCPNGRYQGRISYGNGRCGLCDGYHGLARRRMWA